MLHGSAYPNPNSDLTSDQLSFLAIVRDFIRTHKVSPTYNDLAAALGVTRNSPRQFVERLIRKGYLRRGPGRNRNLIITARAHRTLALTSRPVKSVRSKRHA